MARVTPLEDLLSDTSLTLTAFHRLKRELMNYFPKRDAEKLSWHLLTPDDMLKVVIKRKNAVHHQLTLQDTIGCKLCGSTLTVHSENPRLEENCLRTSKSVIAIPSTQPIHCACGNLSTFTDRKGIVRLYLRDPKSDSFTYTHGPIDLLKASFTLTEDYSSLMAPDKPLPIEPLGFDIRNNTLLNHINLYRLTQHTLRILLPTEDPIVYSRVYNIIIFYGKYIIFPTGHQIPLGRFPSGTFTTPLKDLGITIDHLKPHSSPKTGPKGSLSDNNLLSAHSLLNKGVLTPERAELLNKFAEYLYLSVFPKVIIKNHLRNTNKLKDSLWHLRELPITHSRKPMYLPYMNRLHFLLYKTPSRELIALNKYSELTLLRLPIFSTVSRAHQVNLQDFRCDLSVVAHAPVITLKVSLKAQLRKIRKDLRLVLNYTLPRLTASPQLITNYALNTLTSVQVPEGLPINYTLVKGTS